MFSLKIAGHTILCDSSHIIQLMIYKYMYL